jgi:hypothetical protein
MKKGRRVTEYIGILPGKESWQKNHLDGRAETVLN